MVIGPIVEIQNQWKNNYPSDPEKESRNLEFNNLTLPHIEPKSSLKEGTRILMDTSRFTQFGTLREKYNLKMKL